MDKPQDTPPLPARYYRQKATEARQAAEEATTRAIKERLHGSARDFDKLADAADRAEQTADPPARVIPRATMNRPAQMLTGERVMRMGWERDHG